MQKKISKSFILKISLFATGMSGIVAEYTLSTLATYFLGDSVLQWTLIVSLMLFSMGLGSRFSRRFSKNLLETFVFVELVLSILASFASLFVYLISAYSSSKGIFIYFLSIAVGFLIGLEIPLVTRINEQYASLRENISGVLENDYYGSLLGGVLFAFVGLPFLGITYTPFVFGSVNFLVASWLVWTMRAELVTQLKWRIYLGSGLVLSLLVGGIFIAEPITLFSEQANYSDKIVYEEQSRYQKIVVTQWQEEYWLFLNGSQQLSTLDEFLYHDPLVHPIMSLTQSPKDVLIFGGGDGCAVREVLKYPGVNRVVLVDLDPAMTNLGKTHPIFTALNNNALNDKKVTVINDDGFQYLEKINDYFDVIIVDLPDPKRIEINKLYTKEFYKLCYQHLRTYGNIITQAGSPYYALKAFKCIDTTMQVAGFNTLPLHNQVLTLGEWGWIVGSKYLKSNQIKELLLKESFEGIETRWINNDAMHLITSFGKDIMEYDAPEVNTISHPVLFKYYSDENIWDMY